jgi:YD repeat-containing protein
MYYRALLLVIVIAAQALFVANDSLRPQEVTTMPEKKPWPKSDRENAGLRGLVRQCTEERTTHAGPGFPEIKFSSTTEYDREGGILSSSHINSDGSKWTVTFFYDAQRRLLKTSSGQPDGPLEATTYLYDEVGRLVNVEGKNPLNESTSFQYDEFGRKTRILKSNLPPSTQGAYGTTAMSYSLVGLDLYHPVPHGGMAKTLYDEGDRPIETQVYDADGHIIQRLVQSYNAAGQILETKVILEDIAAILPAELKTQLLAEPGAAEELKDQLAALLGAQSEMFKTSYIYDAEGRLTEKNDHLGYSQETVTKFVYDSHGNKVEEHTITSGDPNPQRSEPGSLDASAAASSRESEVSHIYKYDSHGNWIEQVVRSKSQADSPQQIRCSLAGPSRITELRGTPLIPRRSGRNASLAPARPFFLRQVPAFAPRRASHER